MADIVRELIESGASTATPVSDLTNWYRDVAAPLLAHCSVTTHAALRAGFAAPGLQHAFVAGYRAAVAAIAPGAIPVERLASFAVTEAGGGHPRQIEAALHPGEDEHFLLDGEKTWATLVPLATHAVVVARAGTQPDGRPLLAACVVSLDAEGVSVQQRPAFPVMPDVPHAKVAFEQVRVPSASMLPGDGYERYVRPFRTAEDLHVLTASTGLALRLALDLSDEDAIASAAAVAALLTEALAGRDLSDPMTHLLLAGAMGQAHAIWTRLLARLREAGRGPLAAELERDLGVFSVAARARKRRTERALARLRGEDTRG